MGAGSKAAPWTDVTNGKVSLGITAGGTYTVNSDCTGSLSDSTGPIFNSVIVSGGKEAFLINTPGPRSKLTARSSRTASAAVDRPTGGKPGTDGRFPQSESTRKRPVCPQVSPGARE